MSFGGPPSNVNGFETSNGSGDTDFEALVRGEQQGPSGGTDMLGNDPWANASASAGSSTVLPSRLTTDRTRSNNASPAATFSWSSPPVSPPPNNTLSAPKPQSRAITPDNTLNTLNSSFPALSATNPGIGSPSFAPPQQQSRPTMSMNGMMAPATTPSYNNAQGSGIDWTKAAGSITASNQWGSTSSTANTMGGHSNFSSMAPMNSQAQGQGNPYTSFSIAPPPLKPAGNSSFSIAPPPSMGMASRTASSGSGMGMNSMASLRAQTQSQQQQKPSQQQQQQSNWGSGGDSLI